MRLWIWHEDLWVIKISHLNYIFLSFVNCFFLEMLIFSKPLNISKYYIITLDNFMIILDNLCKLK